MEDRAIVDGGAAHGSVNQVRRDGDRVIRPAGPWTPAVHALLRHLEAAGFAGVPRPITHDATTETVSYLPGEAAKRPWPAVLRADDGLIALGRWLAAYHHAVSDHVPAADARWRAPDAVWQPGMIVRHGDLGPWNTIWEHERLVGVIDWDFAEPGYPIEDVAQLAWYAVPLRATGADGLDRVQRLRCLCAAYGIDAAEVVPAVAALQRHERERTLRWGGASLQPWAAFLARGDADAIAADGAWLAAHHLR